MTTLLGRSPARDGYRWPAEWEEHAATWLSWPHNPDTWPGRLDAAEEAFCEIVRVLCRRELVCINVLDGKMRDHVRRRLRAANVDVDDDVDINANVDAEGGVAFFEVPTDDAWIRDHGPLFLGHDPAAEWDHEVEMHDRRPALIDFGFDSWGKKYPPWDRDDAVPGRIAALRDLRRYRSEFVLEGGSIDGNGRGTVLTTESCLLNPNRSLDGRPRLREDIEQLLADWLGARNVLWLESGIAGDDTDGHIDGIARFVAAKRIVACVEDDPNDHNYAPLRENFERLREFRDPLDRPFEIVPLPMPPPLEVAGQRCPASYANFYLANGVALVPTFSVDNDDRALSILRECLPGREVIGIPSSDLIVGLGAVHCLTQQEPRDDWTEGDRGAMS